MCNITLSNHQGYIQNLQLNTQLFCYAPCLDILAFIPFLLVFRVRIPYDNVQNKETANLLPLLLCFNLYSAECFSYKMSDHVNIIPM